MGKRKTRAYGGYQAGPNCQRKPIEEKQEVEYESSEDSFILDTPAEQAHISDESDNETNIPTTTIKVNVKQVYKNPNDAACYVPPAPGSSVVSHEAHPDEIGYEISFEEIEPKSKNKKGDWKESMFRTQRNRNRPADFSQQNITKERVEFDGPYRTHAFGNQFGHKVWKPGPSSQLPDKRFDLAPVGSKIPDVFDDCTDIKLVDWDTISISSSAVWENNPMSFK